MEILMAVEGGAFDDGGAFEVMGVAAAIQHQRGFRCVNDPEESRVFTEGDLQHSFYLELAYDLPAQI